MSRQLNPSQIWSQVPVANRLIEVNTKTGFSLTAGSYAVLASSTQQGSFSWNGASSGTASISSVTLTRASLFDGGLQPDTTAAGSMIARVSLTSSTLVTANSNSATGNKTTNFGVAEFF